jgi:hypothetical protein
MISVDKDGIIEYNADWQPSEDGIVSIGSIFYKLLLDNLPEQMLEEIKQKCIVNNMDAEYIAIANIIGNLLEEKNNEVDSVVVPPDKVFHI